MTDHTHPLLCDLNAKQVQAVTAPHGHHLVLAGAGSGKTRVLTHRIAWLVQEQGVLPEQILAVTFTNKAANELKSRVESLLNRPAYGMWIGTFHGLCHRLLRLHWQEANLDNAFSIMDSDDQLRLVKKIIKECELDDSKWPAKKVMYRINAFKEAGQRVKDLPPTTSQYEQTLIQLYQVYEDYCNRAFLVDFTELLLRTCELFEQHEHLQKHYHSVFHHILVDEFQDTNGLQYRWLQALMGPHTEVMVVGDDDQSIYGWRGARIDHIHRFGEMASIIRLEQNYRSTQTILSAANAVIAHNENRLGKDLWTDAEEGEPIELIEAFNDLDEAKMVASIVKTWEQQGGSYSEVAILYRSNAQSRLLEEQFSRLSIPYRVYGGLRFFDRAEIKDALAYLRVLLSRHDDGALERIINLPARGIGATSLQKIRTIASQQRTSLWQACEQALQGDVLTKRASSAIASFMELINTIDAECGGVALDHLCQKVLDDSGLMAYYQGLERTEQNQAKLDNLGELINALGDFMQESPNAALSDFLAQVSLNSELEQSEVPMDQVQLMTLHAAKGLEFPLVCLTGLEEGLFPHAMSMGDGSQIEEERRLCYVGMTRAMKKLFLCYAHSRRINGHDSYQRRSRFLDEVPKQYLHQDSAHSPTPFAESLEDEQQAGFSLGESVMHPQFGRGIIVGAEGRGSQTKVQIRFENAGTKWLMLSYAPLERM